MPRLITSAPAARLAAILRSSSAKAYGGIRCRRSLGFTATASTLAADRAPAATSSSSCGGRQLLHEHIAEPALVHGLGPSRQRHLELLDRVQLDGALRIADRNVTKAPHPLFSGLATGRLAGLRAGARERRGSDAQLAAAVGRAARIVLRPQPRGAHLYATAERPVHA